SGFNHTDLVLLTGDTTADVPVLQLQLQFLNNTLISGPDTSGETFPVLYLGPQPGGVLLSTNVTVTFQYLNIVNVIAKFTISSSGSSSSSSSNSSNNSSSNNGTGSNSSSSSSGVIGTASWSLSLDSFSLSPGSLLRLVRSRVVLQDCQVAQQLYDAASGQHRPQPPGFNITQRDVVREVLANRVQLPHLELRDVIIGCNEVCGMTGNRTLTVNSQTDWYTAMSVINRHADGCNGYVVELATNISMVPSPNLQPPSSPYPPQSSTATSRFLVEATGGSGVPYKPVFVQVNLTLRGVAEVVVLDAALLRSVFLVQPPARISLERITLINLASPQTGVLAIPMYFVARPEPYVTSSQSVILTNVTLVLSSDEQSYEISWLRSLEDESNLMAPVMMRWLADAVQVARLSSFTATSFTLSRLIGLGIDATDLVVTSAPPPPFTLSQPTIGISHFAPSPLDSYPQILGVNSTAALVSALNASAGDLTSQPGLFQTYPGVPNLAAVSLYSYNRTAASVFAPVSYGRVVLQRSYVVGPYVSVISGAAAASGLLQSPVLDFGHTRSTWAVWGGIGFSLTLRNLTLVGLGSPSRWPSDRLVRCLDLPVWVLEGSRAPSLSGDPPPLILAGATVSVSSQELQIWVACYQVLASGSSSVSASQMSSSSAAAALSNFSPQLQSACRSLGIQVFNATIGGPHALIINSMLGIGMRVENVSLRDDITPYQRYDLDELLPGAIMTPLATTSAHQNSSIKWIIPVVVVAVVVILTAISISVIVLIDRRHGSTRYINIHMRKAMQRSPSSGVNRDPEASTSSWGGGGSSSRLAASRPDGGGGGGGNGSVAGGSSSLAGGGGGAMDYDVGGASTSVQSGIGRSRSQMPTLAAAEPGLEPASGSRCGDGNGGNFGSHPSQTLPGGGYVESSRRDFQGDRSRRIRHNSTYGNGSN
ncbi:hypothetical protein Vafri_9390, partial [Volvox africanus]